MTNPLKSGVEGATCVLLIDDDAELCDLVAQYLEARGFVVESENDGARGLQRAQSGGYALLVLDVMLPTLDGFEVLKRLRAHVEPNIAHLPVVMLTAHGDEVDRIVGLELGADDYLPKPFNPRELLARVRAILRRTSTSTLQSLPAPQEPGAECLAIGNLVMDVGARLLLRCGTPIDVTAAEFDLLRCLLRAPGRVVTRDELAQRVLCRKLLPFDRSLDMHISKLRRKLGPAQDGGERIKTVRGVGYILATPPAYPGAAAPA